MADQDETNRGPTTMWAYGHALSAAVDRRPLPTVQSHDHPATVRGVARGAGCSYGDQSWLTGGTSWQAPAGVRMVGDDVVVGAGTPLRDVLTVLWPDGRTLPVLPGSLSVTVGGAIAADVHGKNHPHAGTFGRHVKALDLATPTGTHHAVPGNDIFDATTGGMGLTGTITSATLATVEQATGWATHATTRTVGSRSILDAVATAVTTHDHVAAWIDLAGPAIRGIIETTDAISSPPAGTNRHPLPRPPRIRVPRIPLRLVRPATIRAANQARWSRCRPDPTVVPLASALMPLDAVAGVAHAYGPHGFVQHQTFLPDGHEDLLSDLLDRYRTIPTVAALAVLKRLGPAGPGYLSFPGAGWTLAVDLPVGDPTLGDTLDGIDADVAAVGGRVYLAKDATARPGVVAAMYPRLPAWRTVADRVDPDHIMSSDLDRRLGLRRPRPAGPTAICHDASGEGERHA